VLATIRMWTPQQWSVAAVGALGTALLIGLPTDVIPNPVFGRPVAVTWWSYPALLVTAALAGLLLATYVRGQSTPHDGALLTIDDDRASRLGGIGGALTYFAVGCPVCNKVVLLALGTTGARTWFEPIQPLLALASIALLWVALRARLRSADTCAVTRQR
jgi:hypothetical protein